MMASTRICHLKIQVRLDIHCVDIVDLRKYIQGLLWTLADKYALRFCSRLYILNIFTLLLCRF